MQILAIDVGTSSVKAAVLDLASSSPVGILGRASYALDHPTPDGAEVPAERVWQAVVDAARQASRSAPDIQGVGLAVMTPCLVLLDAAARLLAPIWTHLDRRSRPAARQTWADVGESFLETTGNRPVPGGITAISWRQLLQQDPYLVRSVRHYLHLNSWLALHMTGATAFDFGNACVSGLFGTMTDQQWSPRWCDYFQVDPSWLPPVVDAATTIGNVRAGVAAELGVPAGVPLKLGLTDTSSAMAAAGMVPGDLLHIVGTTQVVVGLTDRPVPGPRVVTRRHGTGPLFIQAAHNPVGGVALDWLRDLCFRDQSTEEFYRQTIPLARQRQTRVTLDPAYLGGDRLEIEAHRAAFRDLTLATDRIDLLAAVLDAMVRCHRRALLELGLPTPLGTGQDRGRIFMTGGAAAVVRELIPEYEGRAIAMIDEGALRGVARLFDPHAAGQHYDRI
jgi:xylulokinase